MVALKLDPRLLGTWELVSFWWRQLPDGCVTKPWGASPVGRITYDADGHVTALVMHESRNEAGGHCSPDEVQAEFSAYFGTYSVDIEQGMVIHQVTASLSAAHASGEMRVRFNVVGIKLTIWQSRESDPWRR